MEQTEDTIGMLDLMLRPAFCVRNGTIVRVNQGAKQYFIEENRAFEELLDIGREEYGAFSGGSLFLTLRISGQQLGASVTRMADFDVVILEEEAQQAELRTLALAAQQLRGPLSGIMSTADRLFSALAEEMPDTRMETAWINRGLFQLHRMISNMSDAARYQNSSPQLKMLDVGALLAGVFRKAGALAESAGVHIDYQGLPAPANGLADAEMLERAVHNLLSNAMKFSPRGSTISARLTRRNARLCLTIQDCGDGIPENVRAGVFSQFCREPSVLEDSRFGMGLGTVLVRIAAAAHRGTVLIEQPKSGGTRITMTMELQKPGMVELRSPVLAVDYAGERDHALTELSEVLPSELYETENLL